MKRSILTGLGLGCAAAALWLGAAQAQTAVHKAAIPSGPGSISGVWTPADFDRSVFRPADKNEVLTIEGDQPPLQPWVTALMKKRRDDAKAGHPFASLQSKCLPAGMPQMMFGSGLPHQTVETPGQITILVEELTFFRIIRMNAKHVEDPDPSYFGDSVGHWEKDGSLVVDTIGVGEQTELPGGIPHSDQLHIVEKFLRTSQDRIELQMTFDDPKAFTRPWTTVEHLQLEPNKKIEEYYCENNRNVAVGDTTTAVLKSSTP